MIRLILRVEDFRDAEHWRWLLTDDSGEFLADHQVALDPEEPEYEGFVDLAGFLGDRAVPDQRLKSEAELVDRIGGWIGQHVLGEAVGRAIVDASPVVVRVELPVEADLLLYRPLELAHVDGVPLAVQDVSLVFEVQGEAQGRAKQPIDERLRMLAVFSLPTGGTALALRRERYALTRLVHRIAGRYRRSIDLQVLQYGVTRQRLRDALRDGRGWDVVHFSGHGLADGLILERPDGTGDLVRTPELVTLLRPTRRRLKLVCLSSSLSAAGTAAEARRTLSLDVPQALEEEAKRAATQAPLPGLAREVVRRLDCAVLAMRYSVVDDFAVAFDEQLYAGLLGQDQMLTRAVQLALAEAVGHGPSAGVPAISVATPALFGPLAAELSLHPPAEEPNFNVGTSKLAFFPDEPERFVGRAGAIARASMALAPQNQHRHTTVLFLGMAGAGKTACALELAHRHEQAFGALVWWKAPEQGRDITTSLRDLAVAMEMQLPGLQMVQAVASEAELRRFLPRLTELLEAQAILVVLDNLDSLLTDEGRWRDPNWGLLVEALVGHEGHSRLVLTSRIPPAGLDARVLVEPVHALSLDEALLLAQELPNLGRLLRQDGADPRGQQGTESGVALVRRVLDVVQGHPKLLELADAEAADPQQLRARLAGADQALPGQAGRRTFFGQGESTLAPEHFLRVLDSWTRAAATALPEGSRTLFWLLCTLEETDRRQEVIEAVWTQLWRRLDLPDEPAPIPTAVSWLDAQGLVEPRPTDGSTRYHIDASVADAGRREARPNLQAIACAELFALRIIPPQPERQAGPPLRLDSSAVRYLQRTRDLVDDVAAQRLLRQALGDRRAVLGGRASEVTALDDLALVYRALGDDAAALPVLRLAVEQRRQASGESHPQVAATLDRLARAHRALGDYAAAEPLLRRSVEIRRASLGKSHPLLADNLRVLAAVLVAMDRAPEALPLLIEAAAIEDRGIELALSLGADLGTYDASSPESELYILVSLVYGHLRHSPTAVRTALDVILRRKLLRAELELPGTAMWETRHPQLQPQLRRLKALYHQTLALTQEEPDLQSHQDHQDRLALLGAERQRLETELAGDLPQLQLAKILGRVDRAAVGRALPEGSVLVEFLRLQVYDFDTKIAAGRSRWKPARYLAFVMPADTPDDVHVVDLGPADAIDQLVIAFGMMVLGQGSQWNTGVVAALSAAVFDPLRAAVGARRYLVVAPDGELNQVPFAVFQEGDRQLIDACHVSYLQTGRDALRPDLVPDSSAISPPLVLGTRYVTQIASKLGVRAWVETRALRERLQAYRSPRLLHVGVPSYRLPVPPHALPPDPLDLMPSIEAGEGQVGHPSSEDLLASAGLDLADQNDQLTIGDLAGLDLTGTALVVLSSTRVGPGRVGESTALLQRALMTAGCARQVLNLWPVSDRSTAALMEDFYNRILSGRPPAESLREAQLTVRSRDPSPLIWGSFVCLGDLSPLTIKSTVFIKASNPYQVGLPLKEGKTFVGRRDVLALLQENLAPSAGKNVLVLRGQRRTGKTSVLYHMQRILPGETKGAYIPVMVDLQGMSDVSDQGDFYFRMASKIWEDLHEQGIQEALKPELGGFLKAPGSVFEFDFLDRVTNALGERRLLLMIDEFDELKELIDRGVLPSTVLKFWRHLMQHRSVLFLIAGTHKLREFTGEYWSVFFNLQVPVDIGTLPEGAARWLVTKPVEDWYDVQPDAIDEVVRVTGCHPYFTQLVCHKLVEVRNELRLNTITTTDVAEAISRALESGDDQIGYPWTERDCTAAERLVLAVLASEGEGKAPVAVATVRQRLRETSIPVDIANSVKRLVERGVVRHDREDRLTFVVPLFHAWIVRERYDSLERTEQYNQDRLAAKGADLGR